MAKRKIVDERDARACLAAIAKSKDSLRGWSQRNGVDGRSLRAWQLNLSRSAAASPRAKMVELVPIGPSAPERRYVVRTGCGCVEIGDDFDAGTLSRILEVLQSW